MKIQIENTVFKSKKAAAEYYRHILYSYKVKEPITKDTHDFMLRALLERHPHIKEKEGAGIIYFYTDTDGMNKICFHFIRKDGTIDHFSFLKCLNNSSIYQEFAGACRGSVHHIVRQMRLDKNIPKTHHIDHAEPYPFRRILKEFIQKNKPDMTCSFDSVPETYLHKLPEPLHSQFIDYHNKYAILEVITAEENLKKKRGKK